MSADNNRPIIIYISAASDLMAEREALARMIAKLPVTLAWRVVQTPLGDEIFDPTLAAAADLHILVMGGDIRAPVGVELYAAREAGRPTLGYLKRGVARTTAGDIFTKDARLAWRPFIDAADLSRRVQQALAEHLIRQAIRYILTPTEIEQLQALLAGDLATDSEAAAGPEAGHSAVILSRERFTPSQGVIVDDNS